MTDITRTVSVASYDQLDDAHRAVDRLVADDFPVHHLAIVWQAMRLVDDITGRRDLFRSVLDRAWSGAFLGLVFGTLILLFSELDDGVQGWAVLLSWISAGVIAGAVLGFVGHTLIRRRRQFASAGRLEAQRYDLVCHPDHAARARATLGGRPPAATDERDVRAIDPEPATDE